MNVTPVIAFPRLIVYSRVITSAGLDSRPMATDRASTRRKETEDATRARASSRPTTGLLKFVCAFITSLEILSSRDSTLPYGSTGDAASGRACFWASVSARSSSRRSSSDSPSLAIVFAFVMFAFGRVASSPSSSESSPSPVFSGTSAGGKKPSYNRLVVVVPSESIITSRVGRSDSEPVSVEDVHGHASFAARGESEAFRQSSERESRNAPNTHLPGTAQRPRTPASRTHESPQTAPRSISIVSLAVRLFAAPSASLAVRTSSKSTLPSACLF